MATLKEPKSTRCRFKMSWVGQCSKKTDNGWCNEHEKLKCAVCGKKATHDCDITLGPLVCGVPLCDSCVHSPADTSHVTKAEARAIRDQMKSDREATIASRTSKVQRKNGQDNPLNLLELLKDPNGYALAKIYYLEIEHGLMGFFPALNRINEEMVVCTDKALITEVWKLLEPRRSKMVQLVGYVGNRVAYLGTEVSSKEPENLEKVTPVSLLTQKEFEEIQTIGGIETPFEWAPGLFGGYVDKETFQTIIEQAA